MNALLGGMGQAWPMNQSDNMFKEIKCKFFNKDLNGLMYQLKDMNTFEDNLKTISVHSIPMIYSCIEVINGVKTIDIKDCDEFFVLVMRNFKHDPKGFETYYHKFYAFEDYNLLEFNMQRFRFDRNLKKIDSISKKEREKALLVLIKFYSFTVIILKISSPIL